MFDLVRVHNTDPAGGRTLRFPIPRRNGESRLGTQYIEIEPGTNQIVPFAIAAGTFGHPGERNEGKNRNRAELYRRLRVYFGWHEGFDPETEEERLALADAHQRGSWEAKKPPFKVTTLEGEWIPMILDDPEGRRPLPSSTGASMLSSEQVDEASLPTLMEMVRLQQQQIQELSNRLVTQSTGGVLTGEANTHDLPQPPADERLPGEDTPQAPTVATPSPAAAAPVS